MDEATDMELVGILLTSAYELLAELCESGPLTHVTELAKIRKKLLPAVEAYAKMTEVVL